MLSSPCFHKTIFLPGKCLTVGKFLLATEISSNEEEPSTGVSQDRADKTTENIRYGQNISESGMGGMTTTATGTANQEGGYGGTKAQDDLNSSGNPRTAQQYSAKHGVHDYNVGG